MNGKQLMRYLVIIFFAIVMASVLYYVPHGRSKWILSAILSFYIFVLTLLER